MHNSVAFETSPAFVAEVLNAAETALNAGNFTVAATALRDLRKKVPVNMEAVYLEAIAMIGEGRISRAETLLTAHTDLIETTPNNRALAAHAFGRAHLARQKLEQAAFCFREASPHMLYSQACQLDLANVLKTLELYGEAEQAFILALRLNPNDFRILANIGICAQKSGKFAIAIAYFQAAQAMEPSPFLSVLLGNAYLSQKDFDSAHRAFHSALQKQPTALDAILGTANTYWQARDYVKALQFFQKADAALPRQPELLQIMASCHTALGNIPESMQLLNTALEVRPQYKAAWIDKNVLYQQQREYTAAEECLVSAGKHFPDDADVKYSQACLQLLQGKWQVGLKNYEARWNASTFADKYPPFVAPLKSPMWDGKASLKNKTIVAFCEQGAGDLLQFSRYVKNLSEAGAVVDVLSPPLMADLLKTLPWVREIYTHYDQIPVHDYHVSLMSCPLFFGATPKNIGSFPSYLSATEKAPRFSEKKTIGLVWAGDATNPHDATRSMPFYHLLPLLEMYQNEYCFVSLQMGERAHAAARYIRKGLLQDGTVGIKSYADTARVLGAVDSVVSVCTSMAHLSGALGTPTHLLLSHYADWRWQQQDGKTPWYASMDVLQQKELGNWGDVVAALIRRLG